MYCGFIIDFDCGSIVSLPLMIENLWWIDVSPLYKWSCKATSNWGKKAWFIMLDLALPRLLDLDSSLFLDDFPHVN